MVVLHGGLMTIGLMESLVTAQAESRQVIAVELEGHGDTPVRGEPLSFVRIQALSSRGEGTGAFTRSLRRATAD